MDRCLLRGEATRPGIRGAAQFDASITMPSATASSRIADVEGNSAMVPPNELGKACRGLRQSINVRIPN